MCVLLLPEECLDREHCTGVAEPPSLSYQSLSLFTRRDKRFISPNSNDLMNKLTVSGTQTREGAHEAVLKAIM